MSGASTSSSSSSSASSSPSRESWSSLASLKSTQISGGHNIDLTPHRKLAKKRRRQARRQLRRRDESSKSDKGRIKGDSSSSSLSLTSQRKFSLPPSKLLKILPETRKSIADAIESQELCARFESEWYKDLKEEREEGNIEYKWKLLGKSDERLEHLITQLRWRLEEGQGVCHYELGVRDDGTNQGLSEEQLTDTVATLHRLVLNCRLGFAVRITIEKIRRTQRDNPGMKSARLSIRQWEESPPDIHDDAGSERSLLVSPVISGEFSASPSSLGFKNENGCFIQTSWVYSPHSSMITGHNEISSSTNPSVSSSSSSSTIKSDIRDSSDTTSSDIRMMVSEDSSSSLSSSSKMKSRNFKNKVLDVRLCVCGNAGVGKSSLIAVLTQGRLDDSKGSARKRLLRHPHELFDSRTSTVSYHFLGFDERGQTIESEAQRKEKTTLSVGQEWSAAVHSSLTQHDSHKVVGMFDTPGTEDYHKTTVHGLSSSNAHFVMLVVTANDFSAEKRRRREKKRRQRSSNDSNSHSSGIARRTANGSDQNHNNNEDSSTDDDSSDDDDSSSSVGFDSDLSSSAPTIDEDSSATVGFDSGCSVKTTTTMINNTKKQPIITTSAGSTSAMLVPMDSLSRGRDSPSPPDGQPSLSLSSSLTTATLIKGSSSTITEVLNDEDLIGGVMSSIAPASPSPKTVLSDSLLVFSSPVSSHNHNIIRVVSSEAGSSDGAGNGGVSLSVPLPLTHAASAVSSGMSPVLSCGSVTSDAFRTNLEIAQPIYHRYFSVCRSLNVPLFIVLNKCDDTKYRHRIPSLLRRIERLVRKERRKYGTKAAVHSDIDDEGKKEEENDDDDSDEEVRVQRVEDQNDAAIAARKMIISAHGEVPSLIPVFVVSCVTGEGLAPLRTFLFSLSGDDSPDWHQRRLTEKSVMGVDNVYQVSGVGVVVAGLLRSGQIAVGDRLLLGPINRTAERSSSSESISQSSSTSSSSTTTTTTLTTETTVTKTPGMPAVMNSVHFETVIVRSLQVRRRNVSRVFAGQIISVCISKIKHKSQVRRGMVLLSQSYEPLNEHDAARVCFAFEAEMDVLYKCRLREGSQPVVHIESLRQAAHVFKITPLAANKEPPRMTGFLKGGQSGLVCFAFCHRPEFIAEGSRIIVRKSHGAIAVGRVTRLLDSFRKPFVLPRILQSPKHRSVHILARLDEVGEDSECRPTVTLSDE